MKNLTTRKVIVIESKGGEFLFGFHYDIAKMTERDFKNIDSSEDIKHAYEFESISDAELALNKIPDFWGGSVRVIQYDVDKAFLQDAENIIRL